MCWRKKHCITCFKYKKKTERTLDYQINGVFDNFDTFSENIIIYFHETFLFLTIIKLVNQVFKGRVMHKHFEQKKNNFFKNKSQSAILSIL